MIDQNEKYIDRAALAHHCIADSIDEEVVAKMSSVARALAKPWRENTEPKPLILTAGNGGSHSIAEHLSGELAWRLDKDREIRLPCICLTSNNSLLTAMSNDLEDHNDAISYYAGSLGWTIPFMEGEGIPWLIGFSTSGKSKNLHTLFSYANLSYTACWWRKVLFTGPNYDRNDTSFIPADWVFKVEGSDQTDVIQEVHMVMMHLFCQMIYDNLNKKT